MKPNFLDRLFNRRDTKMYQNLPIESLANTPFGDLHAMTHYENDRYENGYSSIRAIANRFMTIKPYAIDDNGKPLTTTPNAINALSRPNQEMSGVDFRDTLAVMSMVHDKTFILVWEKNGTEAVPATENITEERIAGFTFLENVSEEVFDGKLQYRVQWGTAQVILYPYQVITIYDVNPNRIAGGYSPSKAARRWTRIDDYIADYQTGFFENGAIPSGQFIITAPSAKEYQDIVSKMQKSHRGAGQNNNVMYSYQPIDPATGKSAQGTVTWVPFNTNNKDLSLDTLFDQANKKIDSVYGVSAFIRAIDEAPNFATAQVIERNFVENTVRPFAIKKWARFQHELNRITGGLGYGISFKLPTPHIAEEEESKARTDTLRVSALTTLTTFGYSLDSSIDALQLPNNWKLLKKGDSTTTTINNDQEDVDEGGETEVSPKDPNVLNKGGSKRTNPKEPKLLTEDEILNTQADLEVPARKLMQSQVDRAVAALDVVDVATDEEKDTFVDEMMVVISGIMLLRGIQQWEEGKNIVLSAGLSAPSGAYELSQEAINRYRTYLNTIADSYSEDTSKSIRAVLDRANTEGFDRAATRAALQNIMTTDEWRVQRLAVSESSRSSSISGVEAMIEIEKQTEATIEKSMQSLSGSPCQYCATRIGVWYPVGDVMVPKGTEIQGIDGGLFVNNWDDNGGHDIHANGKCVPQYRVV